MDDAVRLLLAEDVTEVMVGTKRRLVALLWQDEPTDAGMSPLATVILRSAQNLAESYLSGLRCWRSRSSNRGAATMPTLSGYRIMWMVLMFDPPVMTKLAAEGCDEVPPMAAG